ncbi:4-carboxy-4-hydroxy-2-oxoadipate aldolase/oxaloacetate decarboxylase [Streptomyces sp. NPDC005538]|uniref:RraA family protein n=1 Tax=unclassified Streptomyces TaxID=2593676 RepID=UPI0033A7B70C
MPLRPRITTSIDRTDGTVANALGAFGAATVHEANAWAGAMRGIRPVTPGLTAPSEYGMFGDLPATSARALGLAGVALAAGVRDVRSLREMEFPVWARAAAVRGTGKASPGWLNVPISCGGAVVNPGDVVVADDGRVGVVERADAEGVLANVKARTENEEAVPPRFAAGELGVGLGGLRPMPAGLERDAR